MHPRMGLFRAAAVSPSVAAERDKLYGPSAAKKAARADIPEFKVDPDADSWQGSKEVQLDLKTVTSTSASVSTP